MVVVVKLLLASLGIAVCISLWTVYPISHHRHLILQSQL